MVRIQLVLTPTELALVDQMVELTGSKRTEVIKSALTVYHWFVRQALTGGRVVARTQTGEEIGLETAELPVLEGKGNRLSPEELGLLTKRLAAASKRTHIQTPQLPVFAGPLYALFVRFEIPWASGSNVQGEACGAG